MSISSCLFHGSWLPVPCFAGQTRAVPGHALRTRSPSRAGNGNSTTATLGLLTTTSPTTTRHIALHDYVSGRTVSTMPGKVVQGLLPAHVRFAFWCAPPGNDFHSCLIICFKYTYGWTWNARKFDRAMCSVSMSNRELQNHSLVGRGKCCDS